MQVALVYDAGRAGQRLVNSLIEEFNEPVHHSTTKGEILWNIDDDDVIKMIVKFLDNKEIALVFFVGGIDEDMTQYLSI